MAHAEDTPADEAQPVLHVSQTTGLVENQPIQVTGTGFEPDTPVYVVLCRRGAVDRFADCDINSGAGVIYADADGSFSVGRYAWRVVRQQVARAISIRAQQDPVFRAEWRALTGT